MKTYSVYDKEFKPYGKVLSGSDTAELIEAMNKLELPESGTAYEPSIKSLEDCSIFHELRDRAYGGMPVELGMCWGRNTKLNCLEYHRDSELNIGSTDFILLLAKADDIVDGKLHNVRYTGGCNGNLKAVGKLCEGKDAKEIADLLAGNTCGARPTSCADQLSKAIREALAEQN